MTSLTQKRLKELLRYDPETGELVRTKAVSNAKVGDVAGTPHDGYIRVRVDGKLYLAHVLAHLYVTGMFPDNEVDHEDGCGSNNRWLNIRQATRIQNMSNRKKPQNNTSGFKGVHYHKRNKKWVAYITSAGKRHHLGCFGSPESAHAAYCAAGNEYHGQFARAA